ncbi:MAG: heavy metal-binding domain-containing protein [Methanobrevibacter sp.]|nr:heavy metal-binding domain-containing protein [Candidatus Methanoflexus mossambicus]
MVSVDEFIISTANKCPGFKILETKGFAYGLTVRSRGVGGNISAGLKSIVGGEIGAYITMMEKTRDDALNSLIEHAKELGANALISVRFDSNDIAQSMQEVLAYGTAVVVEKE